MIKACSSIALAAVLALWANVPIATAEEVSAIAPFEMRPVFQKEDRRRRVALLDLVSERGICFGKMVYDVKPQVVVLVATFENAVSAFDVLELSDERLEEGVNDVAITYSLYRAFRLHCTAKLMPVIQIQGARRIE